MTEWKVISRLDRSGVNIPCKPHESLPVEHPEIVMIRQVGVRRAAGVGVRPPGGLCLTWLACDFNFRLIFLSWLRRIRRESCFHWNIL